MKLAVAMQSIFVGRANGSDLMCLTPQYVSIPFSKDSTPLLSKYQRVYKYTVSSPFELWAKRPWEVDTMGYNARDDFIWMLRDAIGTETENLDSFGEIVLTDGTFTAVVKNKSGKEGKGIYLMVTKSLKEMC